MANFYEDMAADASGGETDVSDVDPAEMAQMLQGLDDMDDALFKTNTKQAEQKTSSRKPSRKDTSVKNDRSDMKIAETTLKLTKNEDSKKNINDDFDWDDPLADILSSDESVAKTTLPQQKGSQNKKVSLGIHQVNSEEKSSITRDTPQKEIISGNFDSGKSTSGRKENSVNTFSGSKTTRESKPETPMDKKPLIEKSTSSLNTDLNPFKSRSRSDLAMANKKSEETSRTQKRVDPNDSHDILAELGLGAEKQTVNDLFGRKTNVSKSQSLMSDITSPEKNVHLKDSKENSSKLESSEGAISFGNYAPSLPSTREPRRSAPRREISSTRDPLGLFSPPSTPNRMRTNEQEQPPTTAPRKKSLVDIFKEDNLDQLGHVGKMEEKKPNYQIMNNPSVQHAVLHHDLPEWLGGARVQARQKEEISKARGRSSTVPLSSALDTQSAKQPLGPAEEVGVQGLSFQVQNQMDQEASYALQQQEHQLRAALQLRTQEMQLANIHERQRTLLQRQEQQMQQLLSQQAHRQKQLEQQLEAQQQKISDYLQALMSQPLAAMPAVPEVPLNSPLAKENKTAKNNSESTEESAEDTKLSDKEMKVQLMEVQVALLQCELEKKALESTLENLQAKHKEEMQLMEDCYKRQLSILAEAMEKHDTRHKAENERIEKEYKEHLTKMQEQQALLSENHTKQIAALQKEHINEMEALKEQHHAILEHIRHIQTAEANAVKEGSQNLTILQSAMEQLGRNTDNLSEVHGWLEKQSSSHMELREFTLKSKEAELEAYKENLSRQRKAAEEERCKLLSLIEQLELQIAQQRSKAEEEGFRLRQDTVRLDSRIEAFEREKDRVRTEIEKERQQVEKARHLLLEEQKSVSLRLKEEKLNIATERARLQALAQLQGAALASEDEMAQLKAEAEAALLVAKEATDQVETQKVKIQEQQRHLEKEHRRLQELEHALTIRARELEALSQTALATRNEGAEALARVVQAEERQKHQAADLDRQLQEIKDRERRLSEERMLLSQERMKLHRRQEKNACPNCRGSLTKPALSAEVSQMSGLESNKYVDPKKIILKLVAEKERDALLSNSFPSVSK